MLQTNWFFQILLIVVFSLLLPLQSNTITTAEIFPSIHCQNLQSHYHHQQNACRLIASTSVCHPCRCYFVCSFKMQNRKQFKNTRKCANTEIGQQLEIIVIKMLSITHRQSPYSSHVTRPSPNISTCNSFCNLKIQISTNCKQKQIKSKTKLITKKKPLFIKYKNYVRVCVCVLHLVWPVNWRCHPPLHSYE